MSYTEMTGNLFDEGLPAIGHGCNCEGSMAGGIAVDFRKRYPAMFKEYARRCARGEFVLGGFFVWDRAEPVVYNLATQPVSGSSAVLSAVSASVAAAMKDAEVRGLAQLGLPHIGSGIGGLRWSEVSASLRAIGEASPVELVVVALPPRHA